VLTATTATHDPDGDPVTLTYEWTVDGAAAGDDSASLSGTIWFERDQIVGLTVTPSDDAEPGPSASILPITVDNSAPSDPTVGLSPTEPAASKDDLICGPSSMSTDPDGDAITYVFSWTVDGVAFTDTETTASTGDTVPGLETLDGEVWSCTITATDGDLSSGSASTSVVPVWRFSGWGEGAVHMEEATAHLYGTGATDFSGAALANAGDIDGDGLPDLLVGAYGNDDVAGGSGKAYVVTAEHYLSTGSVLLEDADRVYEGAASGDRFGWALDGGKNMAGGPGPDVAIGAWAYDDTFENEGVVAMYFDGGSTIGGAMDISDADLLLHGTAEGEWAGYALQFVDDIDLDSRAEILIGVPRHDASGDVWTGSAFLVKSSAITGLSDYTLDSSTALQFIGEDGLDRAGRQVGSGDVDGDGLPDALIAAPYNELGGTKAGRVYLVLGSSMGGTGSFMLADSHVLFRGEHAMDEAGTGLASAGDVNDDGYEEILVGSPYNSESDDDAGRAYLWLGRAEGDIVDDTVDLADVDLIFTTSVGDGQLGKTVATANDIDNDGHSDILMSAPDGAGLLPRAGVTYLFLGADLPASGFVDVDDAEASFVGEGENDHAGSAILGAGDINGDTFDDIAIGAPNDGTMAGSAGAVHIFVAP
jgi:hypothetical protein